MHHSLTAVSERFITLWFILVHLYITDFCSKVAKFKQIRCYPFCWRLLKCLNNRPKAFCVLMSNIEPYFKELIDCYQLEDTISKLFSDTLRVTWTTAGNKCMKPQNGMWTHKSKQACRKSCSAIYPSMYEFSHSFRGVKKWEFTVSCGFSDSSVLTAPRVLLFPLVTSSFCKDKETCAYFQFSQQWLWRKLKMTFCIIQAIRNICLF